jgi:sec-independent protein translocase protein TatB
MFDIGWTELLVVAVVMILVVGPKDLPRMLRTFGQTMGKVKRMANEFQSTFNDALREAEQQADIADMKKQVEKAGNFDPLGDIKKSINNMDKPTGKAKSAKSRASRDRAASTLRRARAAKRRLSRGRGRMPDSNRRQPQIPRRGRPGMTARA